MPAKENIDVATTLATFGLNPEVDEMEEVEIPADESEESEELDDDQEDASILGFEEPSEDDSEEEETASNPDLQKEIHKRESAEKQMREWQSRHDSLQSQVAQMHNDFLELKASQGDKGDSSSIDIDDDELIDGKTLKRLVAQQQKASTPKVDYQRQAQQIQQSQAQWVNSQADLAEVKAYIDANRLTSDPDLTSLPTDTVGLYFAVKARKLEAEAKELREAKSNMVKKSKRKPLPPTGASSGHGGGNTSSEISDFERKYLGFMQKRGFSASKNRSAS